MDKKEGLWMDHVVEESNSDNYYNRMSSVDNMVRLYNSCRCIEEIRKLHKEKPSGGTV